MWGLCPPGHPGTDLAHGSQRQATEIRSLPGLESPGGWSYWSLRQRENALSRAALYGWTVLNDSFGEPSPKGAAD